MNPVDIETKGEQAKNKQTSRRAEFENYFWNAKS